MSTTATTTATATSASSASCTGNLYVLPVQDAACALPNTGNFSSVMAQCCSPATVTKYDDDCGLYCLAQGQTVKSLLACLQDQGAVTEAFCSGNLTASATASVSSTSATGKAGKTGTSTASAASGSSTSEKSGAVIHKKVSVGGWVVLGMMVSWMVMA
ncbi:uncharacterized protein BP01DRAFT_358989 [Aspergillus saccharolyticus JOP 1030-1]|uniref:Uncharacterized protein n=1 Tax=Aspergillus saccharolyticus JOP 1030-1 TaxID=1450539 RepID=A0A319A6J9_9EURO|nr:hypothetical protein BP01DRAFT_358989 [Aspergillus saccharolyticus JOP 1030-1]PYH43012.1 hypothetical protein BP01DRAFT_358989 [Aspergillus saccharolyticus JOP 1030-1]